jgi:ABC-type branched-subunit amino acid transport system permease subunit
MTFDLRFFFTLSLILVCGAMAGKSFKTLWKALWLGRKELLNSEIGTRVGLVIKNVFGHGKMFKDFWPAVVGQAPGLQGVVYGAVLIAFVLFEPMGLYGRWLKIRTYFEMFPFYRKGMFKRQKSFQKSDRLK